ncbi:hypothetical protein GGF32_007748, partial [Allomyces javanicus]
MAGVLQRTYLLAYNGISFAGWAWILTRTIQTLAAGVPPSGLYAVVGHDLRYVQTLAAFEIVHALLGLVKSPLFTTTTQVFSRLLIVWVTLHTYTAAAVQEHWSFTTLVFAWSITECIRYAFYGLAQIDLKPYPLVWLRYTSFYPLYPLGVFSETSLIWHSLPFLAEQAGQLWVFAMYGILATYPPGLYMLYTYMIKQRRKVLGGKPAAGVKCTQWKGDGCRVVDGKDFVGDDYNTRDPAHNVPNPGPTPMDCGGHGTHVSGIIGGKDETFTGVAPDVTYYAARVFGCDGSTATDVIVDAIETTFLANVDIINMSLGGGASFNDFVESKVVDKLSRRGLLVASALGNDGTKGLFQASSPGLARQGLGVGSFDNAYIKQDVVSVNGVTGLKEVPYTVDSDIKVKFALETPLPIKRTPNAVTAADDACTPFPAGTFKDAVALVQRGTCTFAIKAANAVAAGAKGVIVFNNRAGSFSGGLSDPAFPVPIGFVGQDAGKAIYAAADGTNQVSIVFHEDAKVTLPNPTGGQPSDFSSWGVDPTLLIKPDIAAPGGLIYSSWPLKKGGHNTISGTSMATPFTAGVLALYLEKNPKGVKFETVRTRLQNTARPALYPAAGLPWPVAKQGPGLVDALAFITTQQTVSPSRIELGDSPALDASKQTTLTVTNTADKPVTYNLLHQQAVSVFGEGGVAQDKLQYSTKGAKVTIQPATITVGPNKSAQFTVTVQPHAGGAPAGHWLLSGYVVLESDATSAVKSTLRVPYAIMKGDYSTYPQIPNPVTEGLPLVSTAPLGFWDLTGNPPNVPMYDDPSSTTEPFTLKGLDRPLILATSQLITRLQVISLIDAKTGAKLGFLPAPQEYVGNGAYFAPDSGKVDAKTGKEIYGWDGTYFKTAEKAIKGADKDAIDAPNGAYYWQLELTAPSTNIDNYIKLLRPVWKSPKIVIDRNYVPPSTTSSTTAASTSTAATSSTVASTSTTAAGSVSTTATGTASQTATGTATGTATATGSASSTLSGTATATAPDQTKTTGTGSATATATTGSGSATATATTGTGSASATVTGTASGSATITGTATATTTQSP